MPVNVSDLARLNKAEMPFGQRDRLIAEDRAEHRQF